jgi:mannose-1-phosphate guanylyltransferase
MQLILLCGGSGKKLWPLSNGTRSKQFLKLLPTGDGGTESMVQRIVRQIGESGIDTKITVAANASLSDSLINQLGGTVDIVSEPTRRNTFPAVVLASLYLSQVKGVKRDEPVVVMPCDAFTDAKYFEGLQTMVQEVRRGSADLVLMGIRPSSPSSKFGYILPRTDDARSVAQFVEKPTEAKARELIAEGAYWNGGVFAFKLGYLLDLVARYDAASSLETAREHYSDFPKISFDYEVAERAKSVAVVPFDGTWKDLGTWDTLANELSDRVIGNAQAKESSNTTLINELNIPMVCYGASNLIVAASPDGILVADKRQSANIKDLVDQIDARPMFEERRWGKYSVLDNQEFPDGFGSLTKTLTLNAGCSISYQRHNCRAEVWTFVDGEGLIVLDGVTRPVKRGEVVHIAKGQLHALKAITPITFIEVQLGDHLIEEDIERFEWEWEK